MKARLIDNRFIAVINDDFIQQNEGKIIEFPNLTLEDWELVDELPTEEEQNYYKCMFNSTTKTYYEGVTEQEIQALKKSLVPEFVSNAQLRMALIESGISINNIETFINNIEDEKYKEQIKSLWEYANFFWRNNQFLSQMIIGLGFNDEQVDDLFILANNF